MEDDLERGVRHDFAQGNFHCGHLRRRGLRVLAAFTRNPALRRGSWPRRITARAQRLATCRMATSILPNRRAAPA